MGASQQAMLMVTGVPAFVPTDISGLVAWFDASYSSSITISGGEVSAWASRVGGFSVINNSAGSRPTVSSAALNGKDVLTSTGTNNQVLSTSSSASLLDSVSAWSIFAVCTTSNNSVAAGQSAAMVSSDTGNSRACSPLLGATGLWRSAARRLGSDSNSVITSGTTAGNNVWHYTSHTSDFSSTTGTLYLDGSQIVQSTSWGTSGSTTTGGGFLYVFNNINGDQPWYGSIAEVLIYNSSLGTTDRQSVETYLAGKWGL